MADEAWHETTERKLATVVFADLVGSTALAADEDPERTRALLERFYEAMTAEIEAAGGTVEKFAGDAVMAAFGAPVAHEDHAERALHSALAMQRRLGEAFGDGMGLRVGVNTGEVVVGAPRAGSSFVSGDAVNVAARLEQAAEPGEILVGERTAAAVEGAFEFGEPAMVEAKGKPHGVPARRLLRALSLMRPRGFLGSRHPFVGRGTELDLLLATYRRVAEREEPHLVTIMGEAGVGKTTIVRALWQALAGESPEPLRRTGRCLAYGRGIALWPLGEIVKEHFGILESDASEDTRNKLAGREGLLLTLGLEAADDLHPLATRDRLHAEWAEFLGELVAERPVVALVEDLHWAEPELLDLLERLLRDVQGPLLLLGTARPELLETRPLWGGGLRNASQLWLEPLSSSESERLLEELLPVELPERLREALVTRAEGNPFFLEELLAALVDQGVLARSNGSWAVGELPAGWRVPDSVHAVLAARIDLLGAAEKSALQAAAVIGRVFWEGPARELAGAEADLRVLEERDFIRRRHGSSMAGEREFAIKHALTREIAYAGLPKARRAHLHAAFARWLERAGEERDEHAPLLAHHYAEAVRPEDVDLAWGDDTESVAALRQRAVDCLRRAAELAVGRFDLEEGLVLLQRALELSSSPDEQGELWREVGRACSYKFDGDGFVHALDQALERTTDPRARGDLFADLAIQASGKSGMWRQLPSDEEVTGWIQQALELTEPDSPSRVRALIARAWWNPRAPGAAEAAREAARLAETLGDMNLSVDAWDARAVVAFEAGEYQEAVSWSEAALAAADEVRDPALRASLAGSAVPARTALGQFDIARRLAARHDEESAPLSDHHRVHGVAVILEVEELAAGWETIRGLEERTRQLVQANLETPCVRNARSLLVSAIARASLGDIAGARQLEQQADEVAIGQIALDGPRIRLALAQGDLQRLEELATRPITQEEMHWFMLAERSARLDGLSVLGDRAQVEEQAAPFLRPGTYLEPFALRALGRVREDDSLLEQAAAAFQSLGLERHAAETRALL